MKRLAHDVEIAECARAYVSARLRCSEHADSQSILDAIRELDAAWESLVLAYDAEQRATA